ncbi:hypothetical protein SSS_04729 [Sarcoptes scabiei]|uniref:Uncharacterized protein n=1 Tax=Sarcoptes scabiei TaxID=52283 RepID=A0A834RCQ5_SARSC|nr:hypothetical protein SSS_04729 [Sarcoptes scabiei]
MSWRRYWHNDTNDSQCKIMNQKLRMDDEQIVPDIDRLRSTSMRAVRKFSCINQNESIRSSSSISSSTIRYDTDHSFQQSSSSSSPQQQQQQHQQHQNHLNFDTNLRSSSSSLSLSLERKFSGKRFVDFLFILIFFNHSI